MFLGRCPRGTHSVWLLFDISSFQMVPIHCQGVSVSISLRRSQALTFNPCVCSKSCVEASAMPSIDVCEECMMSTKDVTLTM